MIAIETEASDDWAECARKHKESWCRDHDPYNTPPLLLLEDGGAPLAVVLLLCPDREREMAIVNTAVYGCVPDRVVLVHDAPYNEPGDLARLARLAEQGGRERGDVVDAMTALRCDRAGTVESRIFPYRMEGRAVVWIETEHWLPATIEGFLPKELAAIMTAGKSVMDAKDGAGSPPGMDPARALLLARRTCYSILTILGMPVAVLRKEGP